MEEGELLTESKCLFKNDIVVWVLLLGTIILMVLSPKM